MRALSKNRMRSFVALLLLTAGNSYAQCTPYWSKVQPESLPNNGFCVYADQSPAGPRLYFGGSRYLHVFDPQTGVWQRSPWVGLGANVRFIERLSVAETTNLWLASSAAVLRVDDESGQADSMGALFTNRVIVSPILGEPAVFAATSTGVFRRIGSSWNLEITLRGSACIPIPILEWDDGTGPSLFIGGGFRGARIYPPVVEEVTTSGVVRFDGSAVHALDGGLRAAERVCNAPAFVLDLAVFDDGTGEALYAAGYFDWTGDEPMAMIARWDGATWSAVGGAIAREPGWYIERLRVLDLGDGPALYAAGLFGEIGGIPANGIAKWDGSTWQSIGGGITSTGTDNNYATDIAAFDDGEGMALFVSGFFSSVGGANTRGIARFGCRCPDLTDDGSVDLADLALVLSTFGGSSGGSDVDRDGDSDLYDLSVLLSYFGQSCE